MGAVFRWVKYIYEWCKDYAPQGGVGGIPIGAGKVFWVNLSANGGDNGNPGTRPDKPFETITYALTQCVSGRNDYIFVIDDYRELAAVAINKTRVHIIGLVNYLRPNPNVPFVCLNSVTNDFAIFTVSALSNNSEIAGFALGGGAGHAGIENPGGTPMNLHIHDCVFGHSFSGNTPEDGIRIASNATALRVEACKFLGTSIGAQGLITRDGIRFGAAANSRGGDIVDNIFQGLPGIGIDILSHGEALVIKRNEFTVPDLANGEAITLAAATCAGILVDDNHAMNGNAQLDYGFCPYRDLNAPSNHWGRNYRGNAVIEPVIA